MKTLEKMIVTSSQASKLCSFETACQQPKGVKCGATSVAKNALSDGCSSAISGWMDGWIG